MSDRLNPGLYEALLTDALQKALDQQELGEQAVITTVEDSLASGALLQHLAAILRPAVIESLKEKRGLRQNLWVKFVDSGILDPCARRPQRFVGEETIGWRARRSVSSPIVECGRRARRQGLTPPAVVPRCWYTARKPPAGA